MRMRRLLAVLLLLSMLVSVVPTSVFAVETENGSDGETAATAVDPSTAPSDNLFVDKTVTLTEDGTYSINMEAYATGTPITKTLELGVPLDVVLVVDQSGSLYNTENIYNAKGQVIGIEYDDKPLAALKAAVSSFVHELQANADANGLNHRISICGFASDEYAGWTRGRELLEQYEAEGCYSYAGDVEDIFFTNTGLFVNGEFKKYGAANYSNKLDLSPYDQLTDEDLAKVSDGTYYIANKKGTQRYVQLYYRAGHSAFSVWTGNTYSSIFDENLTQEEINAINDEYGKGTAAATEALYKAAKKLNMKELLKDYDLYEWTTEVNVQLTADDYKNSWENISVNGNVNPDIAKAIDALAGNGTTFISYGMKMARHMLENAPATDDDVERKKLVIVFTDGNPGGTDALGKGEGDAALAEAKKIKDGLLDKNGNKINAEIYTVGIYEGETKGDNDFMNQLSSNCKSHTFSGPGVHELDTTAHHYLATRYWLLTPDCFYQLVKANGDIEYCPIKVYWSSGIGYEWYYVTDDGLKAIPAGMVSSDDPETITGVYTLESDEYDSEAGYYQTSNSFDNLSSLFQTVLDKETIFYSEVELGTTAILKDVLADGFTLTDNTQITVSVVPGSVSEENSNLSPNELTSDKITWSKEAKQVLTMNARERTAESEPFVVTGAFDQTEMTLTATAENGEINVTGYNYAAQFIGKDHVGSKLVVTITGVEAAPGVTTNAATSTNKATSGVYEGPESDADKDGIPGEIETPFPVPNTYLTSEYYYLNENNSVTINPADCLMGSCLHVDADGYNFFNVNTPGTTVQTQYGTVTVKGDGTVTYQLKEGVELEKDIICLFGKTEDATVKAATANANGNMWSEITILPPKDAVGKLHTDKSATLMGDGTYTIDLEAFATGTPAITALSTGVPLDVVLVVDQSGSLAKNSSTGVVDGTPLIALKASITDFVNNLQANGQTMGINHRISICGFASSTYSGPTGLEKYGYSYAGDIKDMFYTNTGLFVDGEFQNYGTVELTPHIVETVDDIEAWPTMYVVKAKEGNQEYKPVYYYAAHSAWREYNSKLGDWDSGFLDRDTKEECVNDLLAEYDIFKCTYDVEAIKPKLDQNDYEASWESISDGQGKLNPDVVKAIGSLAANGGTCMSYGLKMARQMLKYAPELNDGIERKKVVIVFTDGKAGGSANDKEEMSATLAEAKKIKDSGVKIYTVGIYNGSTAASVEEFMNQLSSNCNSHKFSEEPTTAKLETSRSSYSLLEAYTHMSKSFYKVVNAEGKDEYCPIKVQWRRAYNDYTWYYITDEGDKRIPDIEVGAKQIEGVYTLKSGEYDSDLGYYSNSDNFSDLPDLFREIITEVSTYSSEVQLDAKAILKDVMADGFTLTNNTQITVSVVPGSVKEGFADVGANRLGSEHIDWGTPQKVLTFKYSEAKEGTGNVIVNGATDQTEMTLSAKVTSDGVITVTGFNYAAALDNHKENAQYICAGHPGSKLVVTITGVEAKNGVTTDSFTVTNKGASGIYEASDSDLDGDGTFGEMQAYFPIPTTYLSSKTYYVDYNGELIIDPADFLMTIKGYSLDKYGYHGFGAPGTIIEMDHGTVTVLDDGKLKFTMKSDGLGITDTFYLFGHTDNATVKAAMANTTGNMWSKITIITPEDITGKLFLDKEATLTDDGTYTIDLNAYATGTPVLTGVPLDASSILKDVMADGFTLTDNTTITVSVVPGSVSTANSNIPANELTSDKITWGEPQQVLTFQYSTAEGAENTGSGDVTVNDAADKTKMTLTAKVTEDGIITVDGFNYAGPTDSFYVDAQYIRAGHAGSKLMVTITGVEAKTDVVTDSDTTTNKGTSGIYESEDSDMDGDGVLNELQASFPIPTTYLTSEFYYLDKNNSVTINPKDFLMDEGINISDGYHFFNTAEPGTTLETDYGTVTVKGDGTVTYQLKEGVELEKDIIYLFGKTEDATVKAATANANGNMWSEITILPPKDAVGKLHTDKSATLTDNGTYTIDLEAFATGTPAITALAKGVPLDVVLVLDQSASLAYRTVNGVSVKDGAALAALKAAVSSFVHELQANGDANGLNHRISICGFGSDVYWSRAANDELWNLTYSGGKKTYIYTNTGLFVNGEFRNYGKVEYTKIDIDVNNLDDAKELEKIVDNKGYWAKRKDGNGPDEMVLYFPDTKTMRKWITGGWDPFIALDNKADVLRKCLETYDLYEIGTEFTYLSDKDYENSWQNVSDGQGNLNPNVAKAIDSLAANGGTYTSYGLRMARHMLANNPLKDDTEREKVVIVFTDGKAGGNNDSAGEMSAALAEAKKIKGDNVEIYAIGVYNESTAKSVENFMNQLSSNCNSHTFSKVTTASLDKSNPKFAANNYYQKTQPYFYYEAETGNYYPIKVYWANKTTEYTWYYITDKGETRITDIEVGATEISDVYKLDSGAHDTYLGYYSNSNDFNDMPGLFREIVTEISTYSSEVQLDAKAILKDVMADGFTLTNDTQITVSVVPGSVKEGFADVGAKRLGSEHIAWGTPQKVLTFKYSEAKEGTGNVIVNDAADQTEMTLSAQVTEDGIITVTGFNYASPADNHKENAQYICAGHPGSKLVVTITGVEAKNGVTTDSFTVTNKGASGIYEASDSDMDGDGTFGEMQASFPIPTTYMASKVYVVDYAKTMTINPADFKMTGVVSVDVDGYNRFDPAVTAVTGTYGKVTVDGGKITYTPTRTNWNGYDTFYVFGTTNNATIKAATANKNGNMWAKVSVVPANNVYYEDTFVTNEDTGVVGIVFGGVWEEVDEAGNTNAGGNGQGENAESNESTTKDNEGNDHQGGVHGWEDNLADDTGFSDGGAHVAGKDGKTGATATFTFTGTGVDIYSRTNDETGMVIAMLYEGTSTTGEDGKNLLAKYSLMVDNLAASGDYYQIPTLSFCQIPAKDENGKIIKDENGNTKMVPLPHGTYTVKITVSKANASQTGEVRTLYYLDGIRVYNPIQDKEGDSTVSGAYGEKELNANFVEIRDQLLDANSFSAEIDKSSGPVFIDRITSEDGSHTDNTTTIEIGIYKVFGPKNEVYLSAEQIVAFAVPYTEGAHYYIGMKSLTGKTVKVIPNSTNDYVNLIVVGHTTDQYYEIVPEWEYDEHGNPTTGIIYVHADKTSEVDGAGAILALTKLKVTGPKAKNFEFARVSNDKLLEMIAEDLAPSLDMDDTNSSPDVGGNTPNKPNVDINKPSSDTTVDEQTALKNLMIDLLTRIFSDLRGWFKS